MRRLLATTTIYSMAALIGPLVALGLTPLYVGAIGVDGYGTVDLIQTVIQLILPVALWGLPTTMLARTAHSTHGDMSAVFGSAMRLVVIVACGVSMLVLVSASYMAQAMQRPDITRYVMIYALSLPWAAVYSVVLTILRLRERVWRTVLLMVVYVVVLAIGRIVLVLWYDMGIWGMISALACANVVVAIIALGLSWRWWSHTTTWHDVITLARLGAPLVPASIAVWVLLFIDRWFLAHHVTPLVQGQYAIAALLASLLAFVAEPFKQAWQPMARRHPDAYFVTWSLTGYLAISLGIGAMLVTWTPEIVRVIGGSDAMAAVPFVPWLVIAPLLSGVVTIVSMPAVRVQRTGRLAWATMIGAAVNIGLNTWLIPQYGAIGAAWATAVAAFVIPGVHIWINHRIQPIAYDWLRVGMLIVLWGVHAFIVQRVGDGVWVRIWLLLGLCGVYAIIMRIWDWNQLHTHMDDGT